MITDMKEHRSTSNMTSFWRILDSARSHFQPALNKIRVDAQEVGEHPYLRQEVNREESPCARESQRVGGNK